MAKPKFGLLLAPGAGADRNSPALLAIEAAVPQDFAVRRMDFPYRQAGRKAPDRAPVLLQAVLDEAADFATEARLPMDKIFMGGRSMGGRICSMAVAEGLNAAGLVLVSYPLHPPGKPENLRIEHLPQITVPCLFVSGTRDTFGTPAELQAHTTAIPGEVTHQWIEGGDHGLRKKDAETAALVRQWLSDY